MQMDNLRIVKQPLGAFLDMRVNIEVVNMLDVKLRHGHFNEKLQHLHKKPPYLTPKPRCGCEPYRHNHVR